jgi:hypothetical protein
MKYILFCHTLSVRLTEFNKRDAMRKNGSPEHIEDKAYHSLLPSW